MPEWVSVCDKSTFSSEFNSSTMSRSPVLSMTQTSLSSIPRRNTTYRASSLVGARRMRATYYNATRATNKNSEQGQQQGELEPQRAIDTEDEEDVLVIEQQLMKNKNKKKKKQGGSASSAPYTVVSATRDSVYGDGPQSAMQQFETNVVGFLGLLFVVILLEGIFLGASGFLSEEADQFAQDVVYPLFSPTLGLFLAGSTAYGLWKTREDDSSNKKNE